MALIRNSTYRAPSWLPGGHAQTIYPALFRRLEPVTARAERLELADGDFMDRFLAALRAKIRAKKRIFPDQLDLTGIDRIRTFQEFDDRFTAPIHGFRDAADYWARSSSRPFLPCVTLPTLLINAANDPFLGPGCHPWDEAAGSGFFHFESPATGGHVGFPTLGNGGEYWSETRAAEFLAGL